MGRNSTGVALSSMGTNSMGKLAVGRRGDVTPEIMRLNRHVAFEGR